MRISLHQHLNIVLSAFKCCFTGIAVKKQIDVSFFTGECYYGIAQKKSFLVSNSTLLLANGERLWSETRIEVCNNQQMLAIRCLHPLV